MSARLPVGIRFTLGILDDVRAVLPDDFATAPFKKYDGKMEVLEKRIKALPHVEECELGHVNYVTVDADEMDFVQAQALYERTEEAVRQEIVKWGRELARVKA